MLPKRQTSKRMITGTRSTSLTGWKSCLHTLATLSKSPSRPRHVRWLEKKQPHACVSEHGSHSAILPGGLDSVLFLRRRCRRKMRSHLIATIWAPTENATGYRSFPLFERFFQKKVSRRAVSADGRRARSVHVDACQDSAELVRFAHGRQNIDVSAS